MSVLKESSNLIELIGKKCNNLKTMKFQVTHKNNSPMKTKTCNWILGLAMFFVLPVNSIGQIKKNTLEQLDHYYEDARIAWDVPGLAVGIVYNDTLVLCKGYGTREIGKPEKVDEHTVFAIASITKTFTASAIAKLHEQGKLDYDDKVIKYLPYFQMYSPFVTAEMNIKDLLSHKSGLKTFSGDLLWFGTTYSRREIIERMKFLKPSYGFRESFGYSNLLFIASGLVIEKISGNTWDHFIQNEFFLPLNMKNSYTSVNDLKTVANKAMPHTAYNSQTIAIPYLNWDNMGPAGSILSSVSDMCQWIRMHLNDGIYNNKQILSTESQHKMWSPHTIIDVGQGSSRLWPSTHFKSYGLGWSLNDYHGYKIVGHNGGYDGMISNLVLVPEKKLGFVILTNKNSDLYFPLVYKTLDSFLSNDSTDWSALFLMFDKMGKEEKAMEEKENLDQRVLNTKPALPLNDYIGVYHSSLYGDVRIDMKETKLFLSMLPTPDMQSYLEHWHFDTFQIEFKQFPSLPKGTASFIIDAKGRVEELRIDVPNPDFDFTEFKFFKINENNN